MTIRDIAVAFGFNVDRNSEREAQSSIKGIANLAKSLLGAIGIGFSIAGLSGLAEAAADVEALGSQFSQEYFLNDSIYLNFSVMCIYVYMGVCICKCGCLQTQEWVR